MTEAEALLNERHQLSANSFAELRVWTLPRVPGSNHTLKYSLAYVVSGVCVLRYDGEADKGDHRHWGGSEAPYLFTNAQRLLADFWNDVDRWRPQ